MALTLLLVDSDIELLFAMERLLRLDGFHVHAVASAAEARSVDARHDFAILEGRLVDGSGFDLADSLARDGRLGQAVFFTDDTGDPRSAEYPVVSKASGARALTELLIRLVARRRTVTG